MPDGDIIDDKTLAGFGVATTVLLLGIRHFLIAHKKVSNSAASSIISLIHHVIVSIACFSANIPFLEVLHGGITLTTENCHPLRYATSPLAYVGTFSVAYLLLDSIFDLLPRWNENKLMLFHHLNGVVLISISINTQYGEYMVYTAHMMEVSSMFLNAKLLLKEYHAPESIRNLNDKLFVLSFLAVRNYTSWACVFLVYSLFQNGCFITFGFTDVLIIYTSIFFVIINTFWSYGIIKKMCQVLNRKPPRRAVDKDPTDASERDGLLVNK